MVYEIVATPKFLKHLKRLSDIEKKQVARKVKLLAENPAHPSLRTKIVKGQDGIWESSVNMDIRIFWRHEGKLEILALDVGHHDMLRRF